MPRGLRCRVRLADGRTFIGELPSVRHRALQLGMLHADSDGLVDSPLAGDATGGWRSPAPATRPFPLRRAPAGTATGWQRLLALAEQHAARDEEVFLAPAVRDHAARR